MGNFLSAIFGGQNKTLDNNINQTGALAGYSTGVGEGDTTAASKYFRDLVSGDPTQIASSIAPEISTGQATTQQAKDQAAEFGNRSGGNTATMASADAANRGNLINLVGRLRAMAGNSLASLGTSNLGLAQNATMDQAQLAQQRYQNWLNSVLGKGISGAAGAAESFGLGAGMNAVSPTTFKTMMGVS